MITNARPLQSEFVPADVVHRDAEINTLSAALRPVAREEPAETALPYGPSGTGKTCIAKHTLERLQEEVLDVNTQYVNCWRDYSPYKTLYRILEGLDRAFDIHRQSTPRDELLDRLHDYRGPPYVVVVDEVDQLEDTDNLYDLHGVRGVELVLIVNSDEELLTEFSERVASRLRSATRIHFGKYGTDELVAILEDRARWGLREDAITGDQFRQIATAAGGDARAAIGILRAAARRAQQANLDHITDDIIAEAVPEAKDEIRQKNVEKLTDHQKVLYEIITEAEEIDLLDLYERYR